MRRVKRGVRRMLSLFLVAAMILTLTPQGTLAVHAVEMEETDSAAAGTQNAQNTVVVDSPGNERGG